MTDTLQDGTNRADWDLVCAHLSYNGARYDVLTRSQADQVWVLGDGFGRVDLSFIRNQLEYDWSHIRDSSPDAVKAMADKIRELTA